MKKWLLPLPIIIFFIFLFYSLLNLFGYSSMMIAPVLMAVFKENYQKDLNIYNIFVLWILQYVLLILAYIATLNISLVILFNFFVPFCLIFIYSSQFNVMGYYSKVMAFTFFQIKPVDFLGFIIQLKAMTYGLCIVTLVIYVYKYFNTKNIIYSDLKNKGLDSIKNIIDKLINNEFFDDDKNELNLYMKELYKKSYNLSEENKKKDKTLTYMYASLFQKIIYFLDEYNINKNNLTKENIDNLKSIKYKLSEKNYKINIIKSNEFDYYLENILEYYLVILEIKNRDKKSFKLDYKRFFKKQISKLSLDTFEMKFALRMSIVLTICNIFSYVSRFDKGYWLTINSFLLLKPLYDDVKNSIRIRLLGNILASVVVIFISYYFDKNIYLIIASICGGMIFSVKPGSVLQASFGTTFGLLITLLTTNAQTAVLLRIIYVIISIIFIIIINRFLFYNSILKQNEYNYKYMFHLHHINLRIFEKILTSNIEYNIIADIQTEFNLIYNSLKQNKLSDLQHKIVFLSWRMSCEMEEILFNLNNKKNNFNIDNIQNYIKKFDYILYNIQNQIDNKNYNEIYDFEILNLEDEKINKILIMYKNNLFDIYNSLKNC